jgi:YD repeat-containing protein
VFSTFRSHKFAHSLSTSWSGNEQSVGSNTTYAYNLDDTVSSITDARGAVTSYGYNGRHLVTGVTSVLSGSSTNGVSYGYDAAGNRTSMSHTIGGAPRDSTTYSYDELSRMKSESVYLNALANSAPNYGSYTIGYEYTFSNQLKKVTDPFNSPTLLAYDEIGRTKTVTGTWNGANYTYADNVSYRAWGAVKSMSSGPTVSYNSRMRPTHFGPYDYTYYNDGKLKDFRDVTDQVGNPQYVQFHYMSRKYAYDHAGRISSVGLLDNQMAPFSGTYGYDAFNNMTSRSGNYAINPAQSDSGSYTNNRRSGWTYNAEGKVTNSTDNSDSGGSSTREWRYDPAGTLGFVSEVRNGQTKTTALGYDGDNQLVIELLNGTSIDYLIRSTVLGTVLTKLKANGGKDITYVPTNGLLAPMQMQDQPNSSPASYLVTVTRDPLGIQENKNGTMYAIDPFGSLVANVQPPSGGPPPYTPFYGATYSGLTWNSFINANNFSSGCYSAENNNPTICNDALQTQMEKMGPAFWANLPGAPPDPYAVARYEFNMNNSIYAGSSGQSGSAPDSYDVFYGDIYSSSVTIYAGAAFLQTNLQSANPQNTRPLPQDEINKIRSDITETLKNPGCAEFVAGILIQVASDTSLPLFSDDVLRNFNEVVRTGTIEATLLSGREAQAWGSAGGGDAKIQFNTQYPLTSPFPHVVGMRGIHETTHVSTNKRMYSYSDHDLALASYTVALKLGYKGVPKPPNTLDSIENGNYYNDRLFKSCRPVWQRTL